MDKWLLVGLWCGMLWGCAPQYETRYAFTPPVGSTGMACLQRCESQEASCKLQCSQRYQQCGKIAEQQAKAGLPARLQDYETRFAAWQKDLARYETELRFYEMELRQRELQLDLERMRCQRDGKPIDRCAHLHGPLLPGYGLYEPYSPGPAPKQPTLASETERIRTLTCQHDCACDAGYRQCYSRCGGTVRPYQVCVKDCPS